MRRTARTPRYGIVAIPFVAAVLFLAGGPLAGCGAMPAETRDSPVPGPTVAAVSDRRHTGPFALGRGLGFDAALRPLDPEPVKTIRLDTTHTIIDLAPGVKYAAWTFGDQVPGPTIRARVGDRIRFSMTNRSDEVAPGGIQLSMPMMHSMDFHAAMVSPEDKFRSIAPGQTVSFEFTVRYPGVFMYHCYTPPMLEHIVAGMYGAMVVEPEDGYPGRADREYVIVQSEFYAKPDPGRRTLGGAQLYVLDSVRARARTPTHTVFNGRYNGMVERPLFARPGERVRLFVLNVGPGNPSSFHVVGAIFDKVWIEGNPHNEFRGMQSVSLGASNSAVVEFVIPEKGTYIMVDHHFAGAVQGAMGLIDASGGTAEPGR